MANQDNGKIWMDDEKEVDYDPIGEIDEKVEELSVFTGKLKVAIGERNWKEAWATVLWVQDEALNLKAMMENRRWA